jgi:hypothetical protein
VKRTVWIPWAAVGVKVAEPNSTMIFIFKTPWNDGNKTGN